MLKIFIISSNLNSSLLEFDYIKNNFCMKSDDKIKNILLK
jgi:hypothetical protein